MDEGEIMDLYDHHARALVGYFARRTNDPELALDLLGATFLKAIEQRKRALAHTNAQRAAWLYRIAANTLADHFRSASTERRAISRVGGELRALSDHERAEIERLGSADELDERVAAALHELNDEQQAAVRLRVIEERSYPEISRLLGVSEPTARARVSRALRALRQATSVRGEAR